MTINDLVDARNFKEEINMWRAEHSLPSDSPIIGMILTIGDDERGSQHYDHTGKNENDILDKDKQESILLQPSNKQEVEGEKEEEHNSSHTDSWDKIGKTPMVRPLLRLLRRKVLPVQTPGISSS